ncbi:MAG: hypothetical protein QGH60_09590 [Phycisphaerae bacterium]|jgi:hypothetical protein|nr:hypothetical protein [Phycisphaerae bacterium]
MNKRVIIVLSAVSLTLSIGMGLLGAKDKTPAPKTPEEAELRIQVNIAGTDFRDRKRYGQIKEQLADPRWAPLPTEKDAADLVARRTALLLADIRKMKNAPRLDAEAKTLAALTKKVKAGGGDRTALLGELCAVRKKIAFANPLLGGIDKLLFIKRHQSQNHICDQYFGWGHRGGGGGLFVLSNPFGAKPVLRDVLADSVVQKGRLKGKKLDSGAFLTPDLSWDAKTIMFAYTEPSRGRGWSPQHSFHIFKVNVDGSGLQQITDGKWNDFDPCFMPNGRIAFISERRGGFGRCHPRPVPTYTLHSMLPDGNDIITMSYHETNEWNPSVDHDGMVVYSRWDYIDRGDCIAHHPWITYPDGRDARAIHGNYPTSRRGRPDAEHQIRAIPGSRRYFATAVPHHGQAYGSLIIFDPRVEDDGAMSPVKRFTPEERFPETEGGSGRYGTPWPLSEKYVICAYGPGGVRDRKNPLSLYLVDVFGNRVLVYRDPKIMCQDPIPLRRRKMPPVIPHKTQNGFPVGHPKQGQPATVKTATIQCMNVYNGQKSWPKGTKIKSLRVFQIFPKPTVPINRPDIGIGSETLARGVLGTVPVDADGSINFTVPSGKLIYFQALDENGLAVQSMQSVTYTHPGETLTCLGCHESRHKASPPTSIKTALRRKPSTLQPEGVGSYPVSYPRLVQPVLDKKCVPCHTKNNNDPKKKKKAPDLTGGPGQWNRSGYGGGRRIWSKSYISLTNDKNNESTPIKGFAFAFSGRPPGRTPTRTVPGQFGARGSKLYAQIKKGHNDLKLTSEELHRITLWLDSNSLFYGAYHDLEAQRKGQRVVPTLE